MKYSFITIFMCLFSFSGTAQEIAPYLQYKTVPTVKLLLPDSSGWELKAKLDKKKPLMIVVFSPECDHCKHETEEMIKNINQYKNIQIVMASPLPLSQIKEFINHYGLNKYSNITVGRDYAYILPVYYGIKNLPYHAFYTKDKKLIAGFEGTMSTAKIMQQFGIK